jgi:hypothetical protein
MRRLLASTLVAGLAAAGVLVAGVGTAGAQTGDVPAFCQARLDVERAIGQLFAGEKAAEGALQTALTNLQAAAPPAVSDAVRTVLEAVARRGPEKAFNRPEVAAAGAAVDRFVAESCGFQTVAVTGLDYEFTGIPTTLPAGPTVFAFTNTAPGEEHEMVLIRRNPGTTEPATKLLALSQKKLVKKVEFVTGAGPVGRDETAYALAELEPGRYVVACFVPQAGKKNGKPHFKLGMVSEFTVA